MNIDGSQKCDYCLTLYEKSKILEECGNGDSNHTS